jgi:hypothetical protein
MVAKKSSGKKGSKVKVGKLKLTKETVKTLPGSELKKIKGGALVNNEAQRAREGKPNPVRRNRG